MKKELEIWSSATFNQIVPPFWKSEPVNEEISIYMYVLNGVQIFYVYTNILKVAKLHTVVLAQHKMAILKADF